jgi:hypothetical protein
LGGCDHHLPLQAAPLPLQLWWSLLLLLLLPPLQLHH